MSGSPSERILSGLTQSIFYQDTSFDGCITNENQTFAWFNYADQNVMNMTAKEQSIRDTFNSMLWAIHTAEISSNWYCYEARSVIQELYPRVFYANSSASIAWVNSTTVYFNGKNITEHLEWMRYGFND